MSEKNVALREKENQSQQNLTEFVQKIDEVSWLARVHSGGAVVDVRVGSILGLLKREAAKIG